jgi:hypothetical protein
VVSLQDGLVLTSSRLNNSKTKSQEQRYTSNVYRLVKSIR